MLKNAVLGLGMLAACGTAANAQLTTEVFLTGIDRPVFLTHAGDDSGRLYIIEQEGQIRLVNADGTLAPTPFLDIDSSVTGGNSGNDERGLLGLAFHPDYENNGKFYVNYTGTLSSGGFGTIIAEYQRSAVPEFGDPSSERRLLEFSQPFSNHNGGWLGFGPDGYLYIATGDGGSGNDPQNNAARLVNLLGKMLRIDVDNQDPGLEYAIPADNPFAAAGDNARDEIWDYGLRNPWRSSFDMETGDLWMADVGQFSWEEINFQPAGDPGGNHYGWRCREGNQSSGISGCPSSDPDWVDPVHDYSHSLGCSITGGYVYRGCELGDDFTGKYFFSDFCTGTIWYLDPDNSFARTTAFDTNFNVSSFGQDENGEIYIGNLFQGTIYRLVLTSPPDANGDGVIDTCEPEACVPDFAEPFGTLNFFDIAAYIGAFNAGEASADLAAPFGSLNFFDISAYIGLYNAGCP